LPQALGPHFKARSPARAIRQEPSHIFLLARATPQDAELPLLRSRSCQFSGFDPVRRLATGRPATVGGTKKDLTFGLLDAMKESVPGRWPVESCNPRTDRRWQYSRAAPIASPFAESLHY